MQPRAIEIKQIKSATSLLALQKGIVLLLFVAGLFLVSSSLLLTVLNNNVATLRNDQNVTSALIETKEALIAFALVSDAHFAGAVGPGHLFCPDTNGNGAANSPCAPNSLGRLPRTVTTALGEIPLTDFNEGIDQQFWFAIDSAIRSNPASIVNSSTVGTTSLDGRSSIAAVLIAPGEAIGSQTRSNNSPANYLESANTTAPAFQGSNSAAATDFNDRVLAIEFSEIMTPVTSRVADMIKDLLATSHGVDSSYPDDSSADDPAIQNFADVIATAPAWFSANQWDSQTNYVRLNTQSATLVFSGCGITYTVSLNAATTRDSRQC